MKPSSFTTHLVVLVASTASGMVSQSAQSQPPEKGSWTADAVVRDPQFVTEPQERVVCICFRFQLDIHDKNMSKIFLDAQPSSEKRCQ